MMIRQVMTLCALASATALSDVVNNTDAAEGHHSLAGATTIYCDLCEAHGLQPDGCNCNRCGSDGVSHPGGCEFTCSAAFDPWSQVCTRRPADPCEYGSLDGCFDHCYTLPRGQQSDCVRSCYDTCA